MLRVALALAAIGALSFSRVAAAETLTPPVRVGFDIGGLQIMGDVVWYDEENFKIKLADTGDVVSLSWFALADVEQKRMQRLVGVRGPNVPGADGLSAAVNPMIDGVRITIKDTGHVLKGILLPEYSTHEYIFIKKAGTLRLRLSKNKIAALENVPVAESEIYSLQERYERKKKQIRPTSARGEHELAVYCEAIEYYELAAVHIERAIAYEPQMEPLLKDLSERVEQGLRLHYAGKLDSNIRQSIQRGRYEQALEGYEELKEEYPEYQQLTSLEPMMANVIKLRDEQRKRQAIQQYYVLIATYCFRAAHEKVPEGEVPGWVITVKGGQKFTGVLVDENETGIVLQEWNSKYLRLGDTTYQLAKNQIVDRAAKPLGGTRRRRTFKEALAYVQDKDSGITADVRGAIATGLNITVEEVKELWEGRLKKKVVVDSSGQTIRPKMFYRNGEASYGSGTWLREQAGLKSVVKTQTQRNNRRKVDPEQWWKLQPFDIRADIMRAFCAEALMDVVRYKTYRVKDLRNEKTFEKVENDPTDVGYYLKVEYR